MNSLDTAPLPEVVRRNKTTQSAEPLGENGVPRTVPQPLLLEYKEKGLFYKQIKRSTHVAIYEVYNAQRKNLMGYEIIKPIIQKPWKLRGKVYPLREVYPNFDQFGTYGWYYSVGDDRSECEGYRKALAKFKEVEAAYETCT